MRRYIVKGNGPEKTLVDIIDETGNEFIVMVRKINEYEVKENRETMGKELFAACLRTGYLKEVESREVQGAELKHTEEYAEQAQKGQKQCNVA